MQPFLGGCAVLQTPQWRRLRGRRTDGPALPRACLGSGHTVTATQVHGCCSLHAEGQGSLAVKHRNSRANFPESESGAAKSLLGTPGQVSQPLCTFFPLCVKKGQ